MFLSTKQKSLTLGALFLISLYSCSVKKSNDENHSETQVPISPTLGVSATVPNDILYVATAQQKALLKKAGRLTAASSANLYLPTGDGGLGADLNADDALAPYQGIPLTIKQTDFSDSEAQAITISVVATGDDPCAKLISYDAPNSQIIFGDTSKINQLTICNVQVSAAGAVQGKVIQDQKSFPITINPTMTMYAQNNDPAVNFMETKTALKDLNLISQWLKKPEQSTNLKIDPLIATMKIENINSLTGAKNITSLDLSGTDLKDIKALLYFSNLKKLDISSTRIDPKDLVLLSQLKNLISLSVRNLSLKDLTFITQNIPNLVELDVSGNTQIEDLSDIKNLKNLLVLKASGIGFTNFDQLAQITQINTLDISGNDLSKLADNDLQNLVNLYSLTSLNVSNTHISDDFLNKYFTAVSKRNTLTTFIDRNSFNRGVIGGCENINIFDAIPEIMNLTNLTNLDLHGNGCNDTGASQKGLTRTAFFTTMPNLQTLDISDTAVMDLSGVTYSYLRNLTKLTLVDIDGNGISMNRDQCAYYIGTTERGADCNKLPGGTAQSKTFSPGSSSWTVPNNVRSVTITGCSGANSGAGGGGAGGGATIFTGNWNFSSWGGDGAASGNVNGQSNAAGGSPGKVGVCQDVRGGFDPCDQDHQAESGSPGGDGGIGSQTSFGPQAFTLAASYVPRDPSIACVGGSNGGGGTGGQGVQALPAYGGPGENGGTNGTSPWSSKIETYTVNVNPGDTISINVGVAGSAGANGHSGAGQGDGGHDYGRAQDGSPSGSGTSGANGFLKLEWSQ